jgi:hypothetical protein
MSQKLKPPYPLCYHKKTKYKNNKNKQAKFEEHEALWHLKPFIAAKENK